MPFKSKSQLRACFSKAAEMKKQGKEPKWNCHKWYHEGVVPFKSLPEYKEKVYIGPRGGMYVLRNSRKFYIK